MLGLEWPGHPLVAYTGPTLGVSSLVGRYRVQPTHLASPSASEVLPISRMDRKQKEEEGQYLSCLGALSEILAVIGNAVSGAAPLPAV